MERLINWRLMRIERGVRNLKIPDGIMFRRIRKFLIDTNDIDVSQDSQVLDAFSRLGETSAKLRPKLMATFRNEFLKLHGDCRLHREQ